MRPSCRSFLVCIALVAGRDVDAAPSCSIAGPAGAAVSYAGARSEAPALLPDCDGLKVVSGAITACVQDERGRLQCRTFRTGKTIAAADLGAAGGDRGLLSSLVDLLKGESTSAPAVTRDAETGLPTGPVVFATGRVDVDFSAPALAGVDSVDFHDAQTGARVARIRSDGSHRVAASAFRPGRSYRWVIASPVPAVAPRDDSSSRTRVAARADERRRRLAASGDDRTSQALVMAAWLEEQGLDYDARAVLRAAGLMR